MTPYLLSALAGGAFGFLAGLALGLGIPYAVLIIWGLM